MKVNYASGQVPDDYRCGKCGAHGCKMWREYVVGVLDLLPKPIADAIRKARKGAR